VAGVHLALSLAGHVNLGATTGGGGAAHKSMTQRDPTHVHVWCRA
jgi:hypothetical protein